MHFAVHCRDRPGALALRLEKYLEHRAYLEAASVRTVISGPLVAEDGQTMIGSLFILEAPSLADVEAFNRDDPFAKAGVWETVLIHPFVMRVDNRG